MGLKQIQNKLFRLERVSGGSDCLTVQLLHDGENTAPAPNTAKGVLRVELADVGDIPISYVAPTVLDYTHNV